MFVIGIIVSIGATPAIAQSWKHPPKVDFDEEREEFSALWEETLAGESVDYNTLVAHARSLWRAGSKAQKALALKELATAIAGKADLPAAHYWLANFHLESQDWKACASSFTQVRAIDPNYTPAGQEGRRLDYNLAICHHYSGNYELAITSLKRILSTSTGSSKIEFLLGEALMALGHLNQAIDAFRHAANRSMNAPSNYALAIALDRAERISESRKLMARLVSRDHSLRALQNPNKRFMPAEDEYYTLGLAHAAARRSSTSLYYFRLFLKRVPNSPWRGRVRSHIRSASQIKFRDSVTLKNAGAFNTDEVLRSTEVQLGGMKKCLLGHPLLLANVELTLWVDNKRVVVRPRASIAQSDEVAKEVKAGVVQCLETAARKIRLNNKSAVAGSNSSIQFSLISSP